MRKLEPGVMVVSTSAAYADHGIGVIQQVRGPQAKIEFRPPVFFNGLSRDFSGFERVISPLRLTELNRRPGDVFLYILIAMSASHLA